MFSRLTHLFSTSLLFGTHIVSVSLLSMWWGCYDSNSFFLALSVVLLGLSYLGVKYFVSPRQISEAPLYQHGFFKDPLLVAGLCSMGIFVLVGLVIVGTSYFQTSDLIANKLVNAYYYLKSNSLMPQRQWSNDSRLFGAPYNALLLWNYFLRFGQADFWVTGLNFVSLLLMAAAVFASARALVSFKSAFLASVLFVLSYLPSTQSVLDQDDLICSLPAILGVYFLVLFSQKELKRCLLLGILGVSLSIGAKGFAIFFLPGIFIYFSFVDRKAFVSLWKSPYFWTTFLGMGVIFAFLGAPYFIVQYLSKLRGTNSDLVDSALNKPFLWQRLVYNLWAYNLQLLFTWVPDTFLWRMNELRREFITDWNQFFWHLMPFRNDARMTNGLPFTFTPTYAGVDNGYVFLPLLSLAGGLLAFLKKNKTALFFVLLFASWNLSFSAVHVYKGDLMRYFIPCVTVAVPLIAFLFEGLDRKRWILTLCFGGTLSVGSFLTFKHLWNSPLYHNLNLSRQLKKQPHHWEKDRSRWLNSELQVILKEPGDLNLVANVYGFPTYLFQQVKWNAGSPGVIKNMSEFNPRERSLYPLLQYPLGHDYYHQVIYAVALRSGERGFTEVTRMDSGPVLYWDPRVLGNTQNFWPVSLRLDSVAGGQAKLWVEALNVGIPSYDFELLLKETKKTSVYRFGVGKGNEVLLGSEVKQIELGRVGSTQTVILPWLR